MVYFRSLFYFIYISVNSWYLNKPDEDWYWPVEISQLNSISRCLISHCKSLLDCNVTFSVLIYSDFCTDQDLFESDVEQDWSFTVFAVFFFTLIQHFLYQTICILKLIFKYLKCIFSIWTLFSCILILFDKNFKFSPLFEIYLKCS